MTSLSSSRVTKQTNKNWDPSSFRSREPCGYWTACSLARLSFELLRFHAFSSDHLQRTDRAYRVLSLRPCYRPGGAALSLHSYGDLAKRGHRIATVTAKRIMPPWLAEPASYSYRDSRRLTADELNVIQSWIKNGMPEGDASQAPSPPQFPEGWQLGPPDSLRSERIELNLRKDIWVRAVEFRPSAPKVIHHLLYFSAPIADASKIQSRNLNHQLDITQSQP